MRFYILDDLVSPETGKHLTVSSARVVERDGPQVSRCARWCGVLGAPINAVSNVDCERCSKMWIEQGTMTDDEGREYRISAGIPRFVENRAAGVDSDTQESFGYEWEHFSGVLSEYDAEIENYFGIVDQHALRNAIVMDAGCGMGRWARQVATRSVRRLYAVDFSRAIDYAARNVESQPNVHCIQADVCRLPFRAEAIDFSYCLGVLHHLEDPDAGMRSLARVTRGPLLLYLYYALENRPRFHRWLLAVATTLRRITSRLPKRMMLLLSWAIAATAYWPLARVALLFEALGFERAAHQVPLSHYRRYSFKFMVGDAFDRFATPIERRYSRVQIAAWLGRYGRKAVFSDRTPFWVTLGTRK